jgi:predicted nucleic acid-binding protein
MPSPSIQSSIGSSSQRKPCPVRKWIIIETVLSLGTWIPVSEDASVLAAQWLAPMDRDQRRAHFANAMVAAVAAVSGATLLTGDRIAATLFPASIVAY